MENRTPLPLPRRATGHELWLAGLSWQRCLTRALRALDLTTTQFLVMTATQELHDRGSHGPSQTEIAARVGLERMTVQRVVVALEARGLLLRHPDYQKTAWQVELEPGAQDLLAGAKIVVGRVSREFFNACDQDALREALTGLPLTR